jgi:hypothetical protein
MGNGYDTRRGVVYYGCRLGLLEITGLIGGVLRMVLIHYVMNLLKTMSLIKKAFKY